MGHSNVPAYHAGPVREHYRYRDLNAILPRPGTAPSRRLCGADAGAALPKRREARWRLVLPRQKSREALDEMRRAAGTLEVRQLRARTLGDNPQGPTPFDAG
jgi:hypothetical protein